MEGGQAAPTQSSVSLASGGRGAGFGLTAQHPAHRAPVGQGPSGPDWLAIALGFWSGRALATGTAWAGSCLIHHHLG